MNDAPIADWMACGSRKPWVTNSIKIRAREMRIAEKRCRMAFNKDWMGQPANYLADVYGECAALLEARLAILEDIPVRPPSGEDHPNEALE